LGSGSEPRKIAFLTGSFHFGGTERDLIRYLDNLDRDRYEPVVVVMSDEGPLRDDVHARAEVMPIHLDGKLFNKQGRRELQRFARWLRDEKVAVLHLLIDFATIWGGIGSLFARHVPVVATHGCSTFHTTNPVQTLLYLGVLWSVADRVMPNSHAAGDHLRRYFVPDRKITVIHNGIPADRFPAEWSPPPTSEDLRICVLGRVMPVKNINLALESVAAIHCEGVAARLVVIGSGPEEDRLRARADELGISDRVDWMGYVDNPMDAISTCDICLLSSDSEGFPNTVVEYCAAGRPVVSTNVGGVREIIENGANGFLVPARDVVAMTSALRTLAHDQALREKMGRAGRELVEASFTATREASQLMDIYDSVLRSP
jgi:L-malate glycosyltransferase